MTTSFTIPTLFGRATAVLGQHATLHVLLEQLRNACTGVANASTEPADGLRGLIEELRQKLRAHFDAEEDEGYFGLVVSALPTLSKQVTRLRKEHTEFLVLVDHMLALAEPGGDREALKAAVSGFLEHFSAHERSENRLLQEFFAPKRRDLAD
jgi:hemerythrin